MLLSIGCVGPKYARPSVETPPAFKEDSRWKVAQPRDEVMRGRWWELFGDPELNRLAEQINVSNQNIAVSFAAFQQARALIAEAKAQYYPTLSIAPGSQILSGSSYGAGSATTGSSYGASGSSVGGGPNHPTPIFTIPLEAAWQPDLWGRVRNTVKENVANAQASAADLENVRLGQQAMLVVNYYQLRGQDTLKEIFANTVVAYKKSLELTQALYETGIDSEEAVVQAQTQLATTEAQATNLGIARAQYEHAIALLIGRPASSFSLPALPLAVTPPTIPAALPSALLERRPDIAAAERAMQAANAQIGVAQAAYYPNLSLSASAGLASTVLAHLFTVPSLFWSLGASLTELVFDGGLRSATVNQYRAAYEQTVASYRQTVLTAFQQVEDDLSGLRILAVELAQEAAAIETSERYVQIATDRYKLGLDPYLNVITAEVTLLTNQQTQVSLRVQQLTTTALLIEALGGGWQTADLPSYADLKNRAVKTTSDAAKAERVLGE
jgi:NodT family efflux transporter outer membrane factor (OMF) lipoprotein